MVSKFIEDEKDQENRNSTKLEDYVFEDFTHVKLLASVTASKRETEREEFLKNSNIHEYIKKMSCSLLLV